MSDENLDASKIVAQSGTAEDFIRMIKAEAWDEGVKAVRDWWETPDDEKYVIVNPYGIHPADRLLDDINANGDDDD